MSVPGVGPVTAIRFVAAIDDVQRFGGAHAVQSYLGLVPGERSSSERQRKTAITKAGSPKLRWALGQASWSARRTRKDDPIIQWCLQIEQRRGRAVAMVALARKLAGILFAVWRDGTVYRPDHARPKLAA
jgi:transposase